MPPSPSHKLYFVSKKSSCVSLMKQIARWAVDPVCWKVNRFSGCLSSLSYYHCLKLCLWLLCKCMCHYFHMVYELSGPALSVFWLVIGRTLYRCVLYVKDCEMDCNCWGTWSLNDLYGLLRLFVFQSYIWKLLPLGSWLNMWFS